MFILYLQNLVQNISEIWSSTQVRKKLQPTKSPGIKIYGTKFFTYEDFDLKRNHDNWDKDLRYK